MEPHESSAATGQKCTNKEPREKAPLQRKWASEPSAGSKRSSFADPEGKRHSHRERAAGGGGGGGAGSAQLKYGSGKLLSTSMGQSSSQDSQYAQALPRAFSYQLPQPYPQQPQLPQPYPQQPMQERFLSGAKPQPGLEAHAWPFAGQLPSDDLYPGHAHSRSHGGGFPRQKSPSLPSSFSQYSQSGPEPSEEGYKKEQKPKKPGKYICHYCGRACAKPSVLKKHIRSHTGERPYPCLPCGFSFKTKSNLYKHRKSHAHAIKAGLVPFSELAASRGDMDQASSLGETEAHSDGEQSTDTDEETAEAMDKGSPLPQISFEVDKSTVEKGGEPAYADSAEELTMGPMKVPLLIVPKQGVPSTATECPLFTEIKASHVSSQVVRVDDSPTIKQRLALRLTEKKGQDSEQSLNLLSPHSKGSTDSGYFSRSESAEQQISPPNTNAKSYEEIMFGRTWYYKPNSRSRQSITINMAAAASQEPNLANLGMGKISEDHIFFRSDGGEAQMIAGLDPKQYPTGPCQSNTGLLEAPCDSGPLIRSNSMPTSSPTNLNVPPGIRVSHSFDEMMTSDDVFYPGAAGRRLRRQAAFEHSVQECHGEAESYGNVPKNGGSSGGAKLAGERSPGVPEHTAYSPYGTKVGMTEIATRKRRKEKSVGDEEDGPAQYDSSCSGSVEMAGDHDSKQGSQDNSRATPTLKGSSIYSSAHSQSDSFDTCTSMCSDDIVLVPDMDRKAAGNVISVIQHTNSLSRPNSFEKSESFEHPSYQQDKPSSHSEPSDTENIEDIKSPETALRSESLEQQQSDSELAGAGATGSPNQPYHILHKLVRQPNIQVPEIRVTEEPDKPEKEPEAPAKEPEKHVEEFQWPQRSETLSQLPAEKLPPKKKRLRLADLEHSSGESSFESACTSLSRSPSQESNLSHSSSFSMSFDREESLKSVSPTKQQEDLARQSEFLTVPGSNSLSIPGHHQQREMRRSSSEQAPCALPTEIPEIRSKSFDYGSLSTSSRQGEVYCSASAMKERRRGYLVRQASLSVYPETVVHEQGGVELTIKQEHSEHCPPPLSAWQCGPGGEGARSKRGTHHHLLQQSISEDSQQDEPSPSLPGRLSSEDREHPGSEQLTTQEVMQYTSLQSSLASIPFLPFQPGLFWHPESTQRHKQHLAFQTHPLQQKLHIRQPSIPPHMQKSNQTPHPPPHQTPQLHQPPHQLQQPPHQPPQLHQPAPQLHQIQQIQEQCDTKASDGAISQSYQYPSRASPQHFGPPPPSKVALSPSAGAGLLQQVQPIFATQNAGGQPSLPGMLVPVRVQTAVPSYGSVMYTSVSQLFASHSGHGSAGPGRAVCTESSSASKHGVGFNLAQILGRPVEGGVRYPLWAVPDTLPGRLNTGIPLSLTSGTISTTDASSSLGGSKRMLSPASSLELFIETKQQKRVKEERMYGQMVKELSAVELSTSEDPSAKHPKRGSLKSQSSMDDQERMSSSPPSDFPSPSISTKIPVRSSAPHLPDVPPSDSFTPPLQIVTDSVPDGGRSSPEELDVDEPPPEAGGSPRSMGSPSGDAPDEPTRPPRPPLANKIPVNMLVQLAANQSVGAGGGSLLLTDLADMQQFFQFPSLRTTTSISWCFLNYTKPNSAQTSPLTSVYGSWCISSYNPNPLGLSTKATLALLRSKQRSGSETYTLAAMSPPGSGKLVSSLAWKQRLDQMRPELMQLDVSKCGRKMKSQSSREGGGTREGARGSWEGTRGVKEDQGEKEAASKTPEPTRIKIFEGGYKSNEDYVYVRGRGRGKYICEECGIRCKKPSMLKKHIRTHTDVRPYVCKFCNFAFKTKGNLTKHMKSKAHMKKCLELGVSVTSVEDETDEPEIGEDGQMDSGKRGVSGHMADHQFSDADDSEEDGDDIEDEDEDEDEYDGDSTPKTRSRSASPLPYAGPAPSPLPYGGPAPAGSKPLFSFFASLPSIQITQLGSGEAGGQMAQYQRLLQGALGGGEDYRSHLLDVPSSMDEDLGLSSSSSSSSYDPFPSPRLPSPRLCSPGPDSSSSPHPRPLREPSPTSSASRKYLSPHRRDLSPRGAGRLSPRRDASPLGHVVSPRRDVSPRGHLSPLSPAGRPTSPGREQLGAARRELSPRSRHRGMIRPLSPRRGLHHHQHSTPWATGGQQADMVPLGQRSRSHADMETNQRKGLSRGDSSHDPPSASGPQRAPHPHQGLFSHLPLHSQQQVRPPFPMIPIGGIQMVHSLPPPTSPHPASRLPLQKSTSEESSEASYSHHEGGGGGGGVSGGGGLRRPSDSPQQQQERMVSSPPSPGPPDSHQEESIQTCTKAIASLCIATEEPLVRGRAVSPPDPPLHPCRHASPHPHPSPTPQEGAPPTRIQHFSGPEVRQQTPPSGALAPAPPHHPHPGAEASPPATSKPPGAGGGPAGLGGQPGLYSPNAEEWSQGSGERPGGERVGEDRPGEDMPGEGRPGEGRPGEDRPGEGRPEGERLGEGRPGGEWPGGERPSTKRGKETSKEASEAR